MWGNSKNVMAVMASLIFGACNSVDDVNTPYFFEDYQAIMTESEYINLIRKNGEEIVEKFSSGFEREYSIQSKNENICCNTRLNNIIDITEYIGALEKKLATQICKLRKNKREASFGLSLADPEGFFKANCKSRIYGIKKENQTIIVFFLNGYNWPLTEETIAFGVDDQALTKSIFVKNLGRRLSQFEFGKLANIEAKKISNKMEVE